MDQIEALEAKLEVAKQEAVHKKHVANMVEFQATETQDTCPTCHEHYWRKEDTAWCACGYWHARDLKCQKCGCTVEVILTYTPDCFDGRTTYRHLQQVYFETLGESGDLSFICEKCGNLEAIRFEREIQAKKARIRVWRDEQDKAQKEIDGLGKEIGDLEKRLRETGAIH